MPGRAVPDVREGAEPGAPALSTTDPLRSEASRVRRRLGIRGELLLAVLPTAIVLIVMALVEALSTQRLLFASLASSAFLIYLDPSHATNQIRTLAVAQLSSAALGWGSYVAFGPGYGAAGLAMVCAIVAMITLDVMHPPAVATAMSFSLRAGDATDLGLFALAIGILGVLILLQRSAVWLMARISRNSGADPSRDAAQ